MSAPTGLPSAHDKLLFTPGPLTTSLSVKQAMLHDAGSWHFEFAEIVQRVREKLLRVAEVPQNDGWETVLLQGSGTYGVEAAIGSSVPPNGKLLVLANGAYGERIAQIAGILKISHEIMRCGEDTAPDPKAVETALDADPSITNVAMVHCETTTGILNPLNEIGSIVHAQGKGFIVDAMSSFGGLPIDLPGARVDYLIASPNKCLEGVPGFCFVLARRDRLLASEGYARSLSLNLLEQWKGFLKNSQFRFTPPTHVILAFDQALTELDQEGGVAARGKRYTANHQALLQGMKQLGFRSVLPPEVQSPIITAFHYPDHPAFNFQQLYRGLSDRGMIIYPGKLSRVDSFRIGTIGRISPADIESLLTAISKVLEEMGCRPGS
jgi:2-aminoethylphosphonate-pyruvate transaminase